MKKTRQNPAPVFNALVPEKLSWRIHCLEAISNYAIWSNYAFSSEETKLGAIPFLALGAPKTPPPYLKKKSKIRRRGGVIGAPSAKRGIAPILLY